MLFFILLQFKRKTPFTQSCAFLRCSHYKRKNPKLFLFTVEVMHSIIVNNAANTYYTFWQYLSFIKVVTCLKAPIFVRSVLVTHQTKFPNMLNVHFFFETRFFLTRKIGPYLFYVSLVVIFHFLMSVYI